MHTHSLVNVDQSLLMKTRLRLKRLVSFSQHRNVNDVEYLRAWREPINVGSLTRQEFHESEWKVQGFRLPGKPIWCRTWDSWYFTNFLDDLFAIAGAPSQDRMNRKKDFSRSRCQQVKLLKRVYFSRILPTYPSIFPHPFSSWSSWSSVPSAAKILDPPFWYFFNVIIVNCDHSRTIPLKIHSDTHSNTSLFDPKNASRFCRKFGSGC